MKMIFCEMFNKFIVFWCDLSFFNFVVIVILIDMIVFCVVDVCLFDNI